MSSLSAEEIWTLIEQHRHEFYRFVMRSLWDSAMANDVFSSSVLAALSSADKFTRGTNFRAWMFRILANKCFVANREHARTPMNLDEAESELVALEDYPGYSDILREQDKFLQECSDEVLRAFEKLSTAERSCLLLRAVERFSYREIADILDMPTGTVMTHLARGRAKLRKDLLSYAREQGVLPRLRAQTSNGEGRAAS